MIRAARLLVGTLCVLPLAIGNSVAGADEGPTYLPTIDTVDGSHSSARCDISDDGRWIVGSNSDDIWGFGGLSLHDQLTGTTTVVEAADAFNHIELSDDGELVTYTRTPAHGFSYVPSHIYQYDRILGQVQTVTEEPKVILWAYTSDDGNYVLWTELSDSTRTSWIWERSTNRRVDVTETDAGARPSTPFTDTFDPIVMRLDQDYHIWFPLTGSKIYSTPPSGMDLADVRAVSADGDRILYVTTASAPPNHRRVVLADGSGAILSETAVEATAEFRIANFNLSDDGYTVLVQGNRQLFNPNAPTVTAGSERNWVLWDAREDTAIELDLPNVRTQGELLLESPGICGLSSDFRWFAGNATTDPRTLVRIDTQTEAPTPVDPAVLAGPQLSDQIRRLYHAYFDRDPDAAGLQFWLRERGSGRPLLAASNSFANSAEFRTTYGDLTTSEFVTLVYDNVLGRAPDAEGHAHWVTVIDAGMTRGELMIAFSESAEFIGQTETSTPVANVRLAQIERIYQAFLQRSADAEGLSFWNHQLKNAKTLNDIAALFVTSAEFTGQYGQLDDAAYVDLVYQNVLGRQPEASGRQFWFTNLGEGMSRGAMMTAFSESIEFVIATDTLPPAS